MRSCSLGCSELVLWLFLGSLLLALDFQFWFLLIEFHKLGKIELGFLKEFHLSDEDVLEGEDLGTFLNDLLSNSILDAILYIINKAIGNKKHTI